MGRIILITALLCTIACKSEPEGFDYDGPKLECECDDDDGPMMMMLYNSCLTTHKGIDPGRCFKVACKTACPIEIDWSDFE